MQKSTSVNISDAQIDTVFSKYPLNDKAALQKFVNTVTRLSSKDRVVIIHDCDADGIGSGMLLRMLFVKRGIPVVGMFSNINRNKLLDDSTRLRIAALNPTIIFSTDIDLAAMPGFNELYKELLIPFIVQDHHNINKNYPVFDRVLYLHPALLTMCTDASQYCSAKFIYDLVNCVQDMSSYDYFACLGIIGDMNMITWDDFLLTAASKYAISVTENTAENWHKTDFGYPSSLIFCSTAIDQQSYEEAMGIIVKNASSFKNLVTATKQNPFYRVQDELHNFLQNHKNYTTHYKKGNYYIVRFESPYHISSVLSTILSFQDQDGVWFVLCSDMHIMKISARNQSQRVDCGGLLKELCAKFPSGFGGGHKPSAGGKINMEDTDAFIAQLEEQVKKHTIIKNTERVN